LSARFAADAEGEVVTLTGGASRNRVFYQTELPVILNNPRVTSIDGIPRSAFAGLSIDEAFQLIIASSEERAARLRIAVDEDGKPSFVNGKYVVDARSFFEDSEAIKGKAPPPDLSMRSMADFIPPERVAAHRQSLNAIHKAQSNLAVLYAEDLKIQNPVATTRWLKPLDHLGYVADVVSLAAVAHEAKAALDAGNKEEAQSILSRWALENAGGIIAGRLAMLALAPLVATGPFGLLLAAGLTIGAGALGSEYGDETAGFIAGALKDLWESSRDALQSDFSRGERFYSSPLILDLDGNGVSTLAEGARGIHFDHDGNGFAESTGWVGPADGLLIRDLNGDGRIDRGAELFGNQTLLPNGTKAAHGFAALDVLDVNRDGFVDQNDPVFSSLRIWKDANSNAHVDAGETLALPMAGVSRLAVKFVHSYRLDSEGNLHLQLGEFIASDGSRQSMHDVWFHRNRARTVFLKPLPVPGDVQVMPDLKGMGNVPDLHQAMASDATGELKALLTLWMDGAANTRHVLMDPLMDHWMGIRAPESSGFRTPYDRRMAIMEAALGQKYREGWADPTPNAFSVAILNQAYVDFRNAIWNQLVLQTDALPVLQTVLGKLQGSVDQVTALDVKDAVAYLDQRIKGGLDHVSLFHIGRSLRSIGSFGTLIAESIIQHVGASSLDTKSIFQLLSSCPYVTGDSHDNVLQGGHGDDLLDGGAGNDNLHGGSGDDWLVAGSGNDTLNGGLGSDTYLISGAGSYTRWLHCQDPGVKDRDVVILDDSLAEDVTALERHDSLLVLRYGNSDQLMMHGYFLGPEWRVDEVLFADGTRWLDQDLRDRVVVAGATLGNDILGGYNDIVNRISGLDGDDLLLGGVLSDVLKGENGNDRLQGHHGDDRLEGGAGNDDLQGGSGHDLLVSGTGNDTLDGGLGSDTYLINGRGGYTRWLHSQDPVGQDRDVVILEDVRAADVTVVERHDTLLVMRYGSGDQLMMHGYFLGQEWRVDELRFADGTRWLDQDFNDRVVVPGATAGNDVLAGYNDMVNRIRGLDGDDLLTGGGLNDVLIGDGGNDRLQGQQGDDRLEGGAGNDDLHGGSGNDWLEAGAGHDTLRGGAGSDSYVIQKGGFQKLIDDFDPALVASDVVIFKDIRSVDVKVVERTGDHLRLRFASGDQLTISNYFAAEAFRVEQLRFSNGVTWSDKELRGRVVVGGATAGNDQLGGYNDISNNINGLDGHDVLRGGLLKDTLIGGNGNDTLLGADGDDLLDGGAGNDELIGGSCRDRLTAGTGNDSLMGGIGDDTYVIGKSGSRKLISEFDLTPGNRDLVTFQGIRSTELTRVRQDGNQLILAYGVSDQLTISNYFAHDAYKIEQFKFSDGRLWGAAEINLAISS